MLDGSEVTSDVGLPSQSDVQARSQYQNAEEVISSSCEGGSDFIHDQDRSDLTDQQIVDAQSIQAQVEALLKQQGITDPSAYPALVAAAAAVAGVSGVAQNFFSNSFAGFSVDTIAEAAAEAATADVQSSTAQAFPFSSDFSTHRITSESLIGSQAHASGSDVSAPAGIDAQKGAQSFEPDLGAGPSRVGSTNKGPGKKKRGPKRSKAPPEQTAEQVAVDLLREFSNVAASTAGLGESSDVQVESSGANGSGGHLQYSPVSQHPHLDAIAAAAAAAASSNHHHSYQNTFAQYQFPQNHDRAFKEAARHASVEAQKFTQHEEQAEPQREEPQSEQQISNEAGQSQEIEMEAITQTEQVGEASSLLENDGASEENPFAAVHDLAAVAQAAMGLDADGNPLPGNEESHRALAEAVQRLSAQHQQAQASLQQSATITTQNAAKIVPKVSSKAKTGHPPVKRFQCPKCERAFARAYNLNTHLSTHDPDPSRSKPFPCPYPSCKSEGGRSFSRKHDLQRHVASVHEFEPEPGIHGAPGEVPGKETGGLASLGLGTPGKKFRCEACGRSFVRRDACNRHQCDRRKSSNLRHKETLATVEGASNSPANLPEGGDHSAMTGNTSRVKAEMQAAKVGLVKKESTSAQMSEGHLPQGSTQPQKQQGQESFHPVDSHSEAGQSQGSQLQECRSEQVIADPPSQSTQDSVQYTHDDHIYSSVQNHQQSGHDEEMQYTNHHSPEHEAGDDPGGFDSNTIPEIPESLSKEVQEVALQLVAQAQAQHLAQQKAEYAARAQAEAEARAQTEGDVHGNPEAQDPSLGIAISGEYREEMQHRVDSNHAENVLQVRIKDEDPDGESGLETTVRPNNLREDQRDQTLTDHGHLQDRGQDKTKEHATMPVDGESIERIGPALEDVALSEADAERPSEPGGNLDREPNEQEPPSAEPSEVVKSTHKSGNDSERLAHVLESSSAGRYTFSNNDTNVTLGPEGLTNGGSLVELNHGNDVEQWVAT